MKPNERWNTVTGNEGGISLLEVTLALSVVTVLAFSFGFMVPVMMDENRENSARDQIMRVKKALIGEPSQVRQGRGNLSRFGYVGDMGGFPEALSDLVELGNQPEYAVTSIVELGLGWRGPYIATDPLDFLEDPWGRSIEMDTTQKTSASTGSTVIATIRSTGTDGISGNDDDAVVEIYEGETSANVFGYIRDTSGNTIPGVTVQISYPTAGTVATVSDVTDTEGLYEFGVIPHGERVIELSPKLSFQKDTAFTTSAQLNDVEFVIENLGKDQTTVSSFTLTYSSSPQAYFEQVLINDVQVFNSTTPRAGSGDLITFSDEVVAGTNVLQEPFHVVISSLTFQVPEIGVDTVGAGGTLEIELQGFKDASTGGGASTVNMTGVTFQIVFSDGSTTVLTTKQMP